jgi:hypothetical protein
MGIQPSEGRWEFRAWDGLGDAVRAMHSHLATCGPIQALEDHYLLGASNSSNAKARGGAIKVKRLLANRRGFQRWAPEWCCEAPIEQHQIARLLGYLGLHVPSAGVDAATLPRRIDDIPGWLHSEYGIRVVSASKRRARFAVGVGLAELSRVSFDGSPEVTSVAIEGADLKSLSDLRRAFGLEESDNIPMHQAAEMHQAERSTSTT